MLAIMNKDLGHLAAAGPSVHGGTITGSSATPVSNDPWEELWGELDEWSQLGRTATFWWRDDDATALTVALERLLALQARARVPLSLAIVPRKVDAALSVRLADCADGIAVLQHGYAHDNHAPAKEKKAELTGTRPTPYVLAELAQGWQNLQTLPHQRPVLVPPWNRIAPHLVPLLPEIGLTGLSTFGPRIRARPTASSVQANTHLDPVDWRDGKRFMGLRSALQAATSHLRGRRTGTVDPDEPTGLLTHHLSMDEATWDFVRLFIETTKPHRAAAWLTADEVFGPA